MTVPTSLPEASRPHTRELRALRLFEERGHQITRVVDDLYLVPSSDGSTWYKVVYGGEEERCSCPAFEFNASVSCKHLICVGIMHASRRSGVREVRTLSVAAGDPFAYAGKRRVCPSCFGGYVTLTVEEDGDEIHEAVPCRHCCGGRRGRDGRPLPHPPARGAARRPRRDLAPHPARGLRLHPARPGDGGEGLRQARDDRRPPEGWHEGAPLGQARVAANTDSTGPIAHDHDTSEGAASLNTSTTLHAGVKA